MLDRWNPWAGSSAKTEITELRIYPIKSCRGIAVQEACLTRQGLDLDRRWMFVDAASMKFITIREISQMTLIDTSLAPGPNTSTSPDEDTTQLTISIRNTAQSVTIPARPSQHWLSQHTTLCAVSIWDTTTDAYAYSPDINALFTSFFGKHVTLVYKGPTPRMLRGNGAPAALSREESTNFPDVLPVLVANAASLGELNARLSQKGQAEIGVERFRPNIVVRGAVDEKAGGGLLAPWGEDRWKTVRVLPAADGHSTAAGLASMFGVGGPGEQETALEIDIQARCARCQVPNVDPETAEKDRKEPWDTLVSYRRVDPGIRWKPCFGMLGCPRQEGRVRVGDAFEVVEVVKGEHVYIKGF